MDYVDFSQLVLTAKERRTLETSATSPVPIDQCERLLRYRLVKEERRHIPGCAGEPLGVCRATDLGRDYLVWHNDKCRARLWETIRYCVTTGIALAAFIKSFFF